LFWLLSLALKNASIIDIFWAPGFAVLAAVYALLSDDGYSGRQILVCALVIAWAVRLGGHILTRNAGHGEDFRYRKWA
jgi:steroid 5-alpha reductase family enzyme